MAAQGELSAGFAWVHLYDPHAPYLPRRAVRFAPSGQPYMGEVAATDGALEPILLRPLLEGLLQRTLVV